MSLEAKSMSFKRLDESGEGSALFALWNVEDADHDVTEPGFFGNSQECFMIAHHKWDNSRPPLGKGRILESHEGARFDFKLNIMGLPDARDWHQHLLFDLREGQQPRQVWSYGFRVLEGGSTRRPEGKGRRLHARPDGTPGCTVIEVSPVLAAAQPLSRTLGAKGDGPPLTPAQQRWAVTLHRRCAARQRVFAEIAAIEHAITQEQAKLLYQAFLTRTAATRR